MEIGRVWKNQPRMILRRLIGSGGVEGRPRKILAPASVGTRRREAEGLGFRRVAARGLSRQVGDRPAQHVRGDNLKCSHKKLRVKITEDQVEIFFDLTRLAIHPTEETGWSPTEEILHTPRFFIG
jgi:hypothetical protein